MTTERPDPGLSPGDSVVDRTDDEPDEAVVIRQPEDRTIADWEYEKGGETVTAAEENPDRPRDERLVVVAFRDALDGAWPDWREADPGELYEGAVERGVKRYGFPEGRLEPIEPGELEARWLGGLADRLEDAGWDVTQAPTELVVEQFGETYRITAEGTVEIEGESEGDYRRPLENLVEREQERE